MANDSWFSEVEQSAAHFDAPSLFDHSPVLVRLGNDTEGRRYPFRYKEIWSKDQDFLPLVQVAWDSPVDGCAMYCVVKKLQKVKIGLKLLNLDKYSRLKEKVEEARHTLFTVQLALDGDCMNAALQVTECETREKYMQVHQHYLCQLKQVAKL